jgi:hypothetical protein
MATWDLTALFNAADAKASQAERHLWLARLMEWLRHAPVRPAARSDKANAIAPATPSATRTATTDAAPTVSPPEISSASA